MRSKLGMVAISVAALAAAAAGQTTVRASLNTNDVEGNDASIDPAMAGGGRWVAFASVATNLVAVDGNGARDIFVRDLVTGSTEIVSVDNGGARGNGDSGGAAISRDGRYVAFHSDATNLVASDGNGVRDVFVHDRTLALTWRVSVNAAGNDGNGPSQNPSVSADGSFVTFESDATNLVAFDLNGVRDVFACTLGGGGMERLSVNTAGVEGNGPSANARLSGDGSLAVFGSGATNLDAGDGNGASDIFLRDRVGATTTRVNLNAAGNEGNGDADLPAISADGSTVAFQSLASNMVFGDTNGATDVFALDLASGALERVSVRSNGVESAGPSFWPSLSNDGHIVSFSGLFDDLVQNDTNSVTDVFVHDRASGVTWRASIASDGTQGDLASLRSSLTDDGDVIAFASDATTLVGADGNGVRDVYARKEPVAVWDNYGAGYPGTLGIPAFVATTDPKLGTTFRIHADNSLGASTVGLIFLGLAKASLPTTAGGTLLVDMLFAKPVNVPVAGMDLAGQVPDDEALSGVEFFMQVLESDLGAAHKISFTPGLQIRLGR